MEEVAADGVVHFEVDVDSAALGVTTRARLWLSVVPTKLMEVCCALARQREILFAAATTGLFAESLRCRYGPHPQATPSSEMAETPAEGGCWHRLGASQGNGYPLVTQPHDERTHSTPGRDRGFDRARKFDCSVDALAT